MSPGVFQLFLFQKRRVVFILWKYCDYKRVHIQMKAKRALFFQFFS